MKILVTGGAGYIGSFMVEKLLLENHEVIVVDSLERGHKESVDQKATLLVGNLQDKDFITQIFSKEQFDAVIHFAGYIAMGESMENPGLYFENNTLVSLNILKGMVQNKINKLIFSSTAGIYGNPLESPIPETHQTVPTNPYGESKLMVEKILSWFNKIHGINYVALRYFNAAGASLSGDMGENHKPETHIIPNAINAALNNSEFILYGDGYNTPDGTCIRDYIHVIDLIEAHSSAIKKIEKEKGGFIYNVGTGKGISNKEVIETIKKISGINFKVKISDKRPGDAEVLVADPRKIKEELNFIPQYSDLDTIVKTAWNWHKKSKFNSSTTLRARIKNSR